MENNMKQPYKHWHYYDANNVKIIKKFPADSPPSEPWMPGNGPHSLEVYTILSGKISALHKDKPKTQAFKELISKLHKDKPKTAEHKQKISVSQIARLAKSKQLS